jgi:hypothetical protein
LRRKNGSQSSSGSTPEAEFNFGYLYRTIENHIDAFAAEAGNTFAVDHIADRVGQLLRVKAEKIRAQLGAAELLLEMRQNGASAGRGAGHHGGASARSPLFGGAFDDRPLKKKRHLSKKALRAISKAQKERWAKFHAGDRSKSARPKAKIGRPRKGVGQGALTKAQRARGASALRNYWAAMTPEKRSAEMKKRRAVAAAKKNPRQPETGAAA